MQLPERPGRGGRNQHLGLAVARLIAGHPDLMLLAAGTDGTDGVTDAGALVDAETCARLALAELDTDTCLRGADAGTALAAAGDLVHTGPTGTNVGRPGDRSEMRLLMIEDDERCSALILQHASCRWPEARVVVHSPRIQGAVPPEFLAQGYDAVLRRGSGADGRGFDG